MLTRKKVWEGLPNHEIEMKVRSGERVTFIIYFIIYFIFELY